MTLNLISTTIRPRRHGCPSCAWHVKQFARAGTLVRNFQALNSSCRTLQGLQARPVGAQQLLFGSFQTAAAELPHGAPAGPAKFARPAGGFCMCVVCALFTNTRALHHPAHMDELWALTWRMPDRQVCNEGPNRLFLYAAQTLHGSKNNSRMLHNRLPVDCCSTAAG